MSSSFIGDKKYLSVVAISAPCERLFSETGQVVTKRGNGYH